ncbi:hypothetical protein [Tateyamaria sp. Alg231-49]|uniref:hypothetical protein n=1 Tax=Tateyamaria sp. Alg231-49 TaxID=1922219 RepID=UPI000D54DB18|nr:hypothetical protein [Tateyamaria sp. Alg231-49]
MGFWVTGNAGASAACIKGFAALAMAVGLGVTSQATQAQTQISYAPETLVVRNDRGGLLRERLLQLGQLRKQNRPVEIRGAICFSTCTMFLGLPNTCISPNTTFGFHGPSSYGRPLDTVTFNRASKVIANYYPESLKQWYMAEGRFKIRSISRVKGENIIKMGIRAC